jgi:putative ABC transport system substrate-binding protein
LALSLTRIGDGNHGRWLRALLSLRTLVVAALLALGTALPSAHAQSVGKVPKLGFLNGGLPAERAHLLEAFRQGLRDLGYVEGRTVLIEHRWAEGKVDRIPELAAELVALRVDVIVADGDRVITGARQATSTIPIVMAASGDAVARGFAASLARPGGNITGVSNLAVALTGKWLEIVKEILPGLRDRRAEEREQCDASPVPRRGAGGGARTRREDPGRARERA